MWRERRICGKSLRKNLVLCQRAKGGVLPSPQTCVTSFLETTRRAKEGIPFIREYRAMATGSHLIRGGSGCVRIRLCTQRFGDQGSVTVSCGPDVSPWEKGNWSLSGQVILGPFN